MKMNMPIRKALHVLAFSSAAAALCGCAQNPQMSASTSSNDAVRSYETRVAASPNNMGGLTGLQINQLRIARENAADAAKSGRPVCDPDTLRNCPLVPPNLGKPVTIGLGFQPVPWPLPSTGTVYRYVMPTP